VPIGASELLGPQHRVHQVHERGNAEEQRDKRHHNTYTRSQNVTNPSIVANAARPRTTIPTVSMAPSSADQRDVHIELRRPRLHLRTAAVVHDDDEVVRAFGRAPRRSVCVGSHLCLPPTTISGLTRFTECRDGRIRKA
jgi:hypothetical protein